MSTVEIFLTVKPVFVGRDSSQTGFGYERKRISD